MPVTTPAPSATKVTNTGEQTFASRVKDPSFWAERAALVGLVVLTIVFQIANPIFLSPGNVSTMLVASAILIILSLGQTFVVATSGIDLSLASTVAFSSVVFGIAYTGSGGSLVAAVLAGIAAGAVVGAVNGLLVAKGRITDFIVTLGTLSVAAGAALVLSGGQPLTIINTTMIQFAVGGIGIVGWMFILAAVLAVIAHVVLFQTRFGTHVLATGGNPDAANATGISTARVKIAVYVISGTLAGLAAVVLCSRLGAATPVPNTAFLLNAVAAVVLGGVSLFGGRGSIIGPVLGALLLGALDNGLTLVGVSPFYQQVSVGSVVILAALLTRYQR